MNPFFSPNEQHVYNLVSTYYDNPQMHLIRKDGDKTLYGVQIPSLLMNAKRFLIATVQNSDEMHPARRSLRDLPWTTFQIRTLGHDNPYNFLPIVNYRQKRDPQYSFSLQVSSRNKKVTTYTSPYDFTVSLLHVKGLEFEYPNEGTFISALETFQTIIMLH